MGIKDVLPKKKLNVWLLKLKNTNKQMKHKKEKLKLKTDLKTTASPCVTLLTKRKSKLTSLTKTERARRNCKPNHDESLSGCWRSPRSGRNAWRHARWNAWRHARRWRPTTTKPTNRTIC